MSFSVFEDYPDYLEYIELRKENNARHCLFALVCIILTEEFHISCRRRFMEQKTTLSQSIDIVQQKEKYDEACKKVLAEKIILAWIMKHTMKEYAEYDVREIVENFIVGEPRVAETRVLPDETNAPKITRTGVEDTTVTEGSVTYDIQFRAIVPSSEEVVQMIINVEAQNNTITEYSLTEKHHVGKVKETEEHYDLMNAIMICLGQNEDETEHELLRLLDVLLSSDKKAKEKKEILENEFQIPMTEKMETEVEHMCNLSDGVEQKGIQKGIEQGIEQANRTVVINMLKEKLPVDTICRIAECDEDYVRRLEEELANK